MCNKGADIVQLISYTTVPRLRVYGEDTAVACGPGYCCLMHITCHSPCAQVGAVELQTDCSVHGGNHHSSHGHAEEGPATASTRGGGAGAGSGGGAHDSNMSSITASSNATPFSQAAGHASAAASVSGEAGGGGGGGGGGFAGNSGSGSGGSAGHFYVSWVPVVSLSTNVRSDCVAVLELVATL